MLLIVELIDIVIITKVINGTTLAPCSVIYIYVVMLADVTPLEGILLVCLIVGLIDIVIIMIVNGNT